MHVDLHQAMRDVIDRSLLGTATIKEQQTLQEHLSGCVECQEYLSASNQVIAGLGGFSFDVSPELQERVMASVSLRAQQLAASKPMPMWLLYVAAVLLTGLGCFMALRFSDFAIAAFHVEPGPLQLGVLALWIVPSLCFCLFFPVMHRLSTERMNRNEHK